MGNRNHLIVASVVCASAAADVSAQEEPPEPPSSAWYLTGSVRPRAEFRYNNQFNLPPADLRYARRDNGDTLSQQTRVGLGFDSLEIDGAFVLQAASAWGATGGDELTDPSLGVHEASLRWAPTREWWLQAGRFELAYGDQRVLGAVGWSQVGRAWDGVRSGVVFAEDVGADIFAVTYQDGFTESAGAFEDKVLEDDAYLLGAYFHSAKLSSFLLAFDAYALGDFRLDKISEGPQRQVLGTMGARVATGVEPAQLVVEGAYQFGSRCVEIPPDDPRLPPTLECTDETVGVSAGFIDTDFSATFGDKISFRPFAGFGFATGDDPTTGKNEGYAHLYPTAHKFLGLMDIIGPRTNVRDFRIGARVAGGGFALTETFHQFSASQPDSRHVGFELDSVLSYKPVDMLTLVAGHGVFIPGDGASTGPSDPSGVASWWFLQLVLAAKAPL